MSRGTHSTVGRPLAVWVGVSAAAVAAGAAVPAAWGAVSSTEGSEGVADLLVAVCSTALAVALARLWVITTVTVAGLVTGRVHSGGGTTRRLVLVACGAAVLAGVTAPALATGGDGPEVLSGLALPERAVAPPVHRSHQPPAPTPAPRASYVVRTGDSLWSIARAHPDPAASVDQRWRALWQANRDVVGDDPDLILPGQVLRLPTTHPTQEPTSDGDR